MLELLLIAGGAAAVLTGFVLVKKKRGKKTEQKKEPLGDRTPMTILAGDIVAYLGSDYLVATRLIYDEEGFRWFEYDLEDGPNLRKLVVSLDDRLRIYFLTPDEELAAQVGDSPAGDALEVRNTRFRLAERGAARRFDAARTGDEPRDIRYWDYCGPASKVLWLVKVGGRMTASIGEEIRNESMLEIYPGSG